MITDKLKAQAMAQIRHQVPIEEIAKDLSIPLQLLKEWQANVSPRDMSAIESNIFACEKIASGELVPLNDDILKGELEKAAIELARSAYKNANAGDMIYSKSVELLSNAVAKLYQTMILKGQPGLAGQSAPGQLSNNSISTFESLMKD